MLNLERRCASRITLQADATLTLNEDAWTGTVRNISPDGLYMVFPDTVPVSDHQLLQLALVSEIGLLELKGSLAGIREVSRQPTDRAGSPPLGLAVKFAPLGAIEREILGSLLDELRERPVNLRLTGLLIPRETGDLLLEVSAQGSDTTAFTPMTSSTPEAEEAAPTDRRLTSRGTVSIPVLIRRTCGPAAGPDYLSAQTIDISLGGISLRVTAPPTSLENPVVLQLSLPPSLAGRAAQAASSESSTPIAGTAASDCILTAELVWMAPANGGKRGPNDRPDTFQLGLRFPYLDDAARFRIAGLVAQLLTSSEPVEQEASIQPLVSESLECRNRQGQRLALYHDHLRQALPPSAPTVIISPGYGETKKEQIALAYYFAANGFRVLRYDYTNHVGESEGDIQQSTLSGMKQDLTAMLDFAERTWPASPVTVVASSLAGRVALKAVAGDRRVSLLVLLNAVVDVRATLVAVHQEDHMGMYLNGAARGMMNVLGFNINADHWLEDAIAEGYADLHTTVKDAEQIRTPVVIFAAENDAWISKDSLRTVHAALCSTVKPLYFIPEALHSLHENPRKARAVFLQLVDCCRKQFFIAPTSADIRQPTQRVIGLQSRLERDRARAQRQMGQAELVEFWRDYLDHFHYVVNVHDYWQLLDHIYRLTAVPNEDTLIFDAGCGNGNFGVFLMVNQAYSQRHTSAFL
ncbi:MAG: alpha/beta fold hydrolase, partial [Nitrospirota bacterium]|nr:alpha/beta fold hydrolase [Nitrospirota bacterium]